MKYYVIKRLRFLVCLIEKTGVEFSKCRTILIICLVLMALFGSGGSSLPVHKIHENTGGSSLPVHMIHENTGGLSLPVHMIHENTGGSSLPVHMIHENTGGSSLPVQSAHYSKESTTANVIQCWSWPSKHFWNRWSENCLPGSGASIYCPHWLRHHMTQHNWS